MKFTTGSDEIEQSLPAGRCGVAVLRSDGEYRLVAARPLSAGERLFEIEGSKSVHPSRYSVQIGETAHIDLGPGITAEEIMDRYFWRFMNHGCKPNVRIEGTTVIALTSIAPWEPILFNYNTTEWDLAEPFRCACGALDCLGEIRGFRNLPPEEQERLAPLVAPHIRRLASTEGPEKNTVARPAVSGALPQ